MRSFMQENRTGNTLFEGVLFEATEKPFKSFSVALKKYFRFQALDAGSEFSSSFITSTSKARH